MEGLFDKYEQLMKQERVAKETLAEKYGTRIEVEE